MAQQEIINRNQNPGIYTNEYDQSVRTITSLGRYDGVIHLVPGFSKVGPQNNAILLQNPEDFISTFGNIDSKLERKESYFHRTALKMLETGPTYCISILKTDPNIDKLNWQSLSAASCFENETSRTNAYDEFFNRLGFWQRDTEVVLDVSRKYAIEPLNKVLTFVNYGGQNLTIWVFKSSLSGFDISAESWYGVDNVPTYLHPKEYISDFMVRVVIVKSDWTNYNDLAVDPKWSRYFNVQGLMKAQVSNFLSDPKVTVIADYNVSLIPDFTDSRNRNIFIETIVNGDTDKTGVFVAFDRDQYITDFRNGLVDLIGYNLVTQNKFGLNFLSYKEQIVDELLIDETFIDQAGNSWGDPAWISENRAAKNADGFINDTQLKPLIISQTTTFVVKPFIFGSNSYAIIKGKKIALTDSEYLLELNKIITPGNKFVLVLVMTEKGVDYRTSATVELNATLYFPPIDAANEYVIGYYIIEQNFQGEYITTLKGVSITEDSQDTVNDGLYGWIPYFSNTVETVPKIRFDTVDTTFQIKMRFENTLKIIPGDYHQNRIYYLWYQLSKNLVERKSLVLDSNGYKKVIDKVEPSYVNNDRTILLTLQDTNNVSLLPPYTYPNNGWISIYYNDLEFLYQTANYIVTDESPYSIPQNGGRLGPESVLFKAYYDGYVATGDRVFIEIADETDIEFRNLNGQNLIIFTHSPVGIYGTKIYVNNTINNEGIYNIIGTTYVNNNYSLIVEESVVDENAALVQFFDATLERYFKFYFIGKDLYVQYEEKQLNQDAMLKGTVNRDDVKFKRTLQLVSQLDQYTLLVDYATYAGKVQVGQYLQAIIDVTLDIEPRLIQRGMTRVLEVHPYDVEQTLLLIRCDSPVQIFETYNISHVNHGTNASNTPQIIKETNWFLSIDNWVNTYKGFYFTGFQISDNSVPDGTEDKLASILETIAPGTGLFTALSSVNKIPYRYMIDSFGLGFRDTTKSPLSNICSKHNSLGFFNMPSIKAFKKYTGVNFLTPDGRFDINKLVAGGDKNSINDTYFTLISDDSSSNISYYFPYVEILDLTHNRPIMVPPAIYAADAYMRNKWQVKNANTYPWSIVAGWLYGRINDISALESEFDDNDLGLLNQMHVNPIAKDRDDRFYLYAENTSYPSKSSLGSIHIREALISFEEEMRNLLLSFQWQFDTTAIRETIVKQANVLLARYIDTNAFYDGRNVMDETNNPPELIDAGIGVLDTYLEPVQGLGVIILNLTILRTGQIAAQFFYR